jgi:hypothetical protein
MHHWTGCTPRTAENLVAAPQSNSERPSKGRELPQSLVHISQSLGKHIAYRGAIDVRRFDQLANFLKAQSQLLRLLDEAQALDASRRIHTKATAGTIRAGK